MGEALFALYWVLSSLFSNNLGRYWNFPLILSKTGINRPGLFLARKSLLNHFNTERNTMMRRDIGLFRIYVRNI